MSRPRLTFTLLFLSVKIVANNENVRDGRRMILKRCRVTISRVLLVHGPAVCRLTYDRQQLINAFMSIRLAVHHRFKPRPVQLNPPIHPTDQPTTHPATQRGRHSSHSSFLSPSLFSVRVCMSHALRATTQNLRYHRDASIRFKRPNDYARRRNVLVITRGNVVQMNRVHCSTMRISVMCYIFGCLRRKLKIY